MKRLRGDALEYVYALLLNVSNLDKIIDALKFQFGRPDLTVDTMTIMIRSMQDVRHDDMNQLLQYATDIYSIVAMLSNEKNHLKNPILISESTPFPHSLLPVRF